MKDSIKNSNYEQFSSGEEDGKKRRRAKSSVFKICLLIISVIILSLLIYIAFFKTEKNSNETHPLLEPGQKAPVLVADIGGTNCRLRLIKLAADWEAEPEEIASDVLKPWKFKSIEELLRKFLSHFKNTPNYPLIAVLGIPGPVVNNTLDILVNIQSWLKKTNGDELARKLGLRRLVFLNDFVCNGYGIQ